MNNSPERDFEKYFKFTAPMYKMLYVRIPDLIPVRMQGKIPAAFKRPCDGILCTPNNNYLIELKYQYGRLLDHQKETQRKINSVNLSYYVVRKKIYHKGNRLEYSVEQNEEIVFKTNKIEDIFKFFQDPQEFTSQEQMKQGLDIFIPSHIKTKRMRKVRV